MGGCGDPSSVRRQWARTIISARVNFDTYIIVMLRTFVRLPKLLIIHVSFPQHCQGHGTDLQIVCLCVALDSIRWLWANHGFVTFQHRFCKNKLVSSSQSKQTLTILNIFWIYFPVQLLIQNLVILLPDLLNNLSQPIIISYYFCLQWGWFPYCLFVLAKFMR